MCGLVHPLSAEYYHTSTIHHLLSAVDFHWFILNSSQTVTDSVCKRGTVLLKLSISGNKQQETIMYLFVYREWGNTFLFVSNQERKHVLKILHNTYS